MDSLEAVARSLGGLLAVLALVWLVARVMRGRTAAGRAGTVRVTQRIGLGRRSGVAVVAAGDRRILVGVGDAQVTFLADLGPEIPDHQISDHQVPDRQVLDQRVPAPRRSGLRELVAQAQEKTLRR